jgi:tetratricopeptide (TPR) repeat protein
MSKRARIAQLRDEVDPPTLSESARSTVHFDDDQDDGRPTLDQLDRGLSVEELLDEPTLDRGDEPGTVDIEILITPTPTPGSERRRKSAAARRQTEPPASREGKKESVWDAVEDRYKAEGHWNDLLEMYLQRVEGTNDLDVKGSLFLRIGRVLKDELDDPQQALDAFVEALVLEPRNAEALEAVEATARERGWWAELLATMKRELGNAKTADACVAICEHAMRWAETELKQPERAEEFLDHIRKLDPGHPAVHRRLAATYGVNGAWGSQRESLERALLRANGDSDRLGIHLTLGELSEQRFREYAEASRHFELALAIAPDSMRALQGLERICRVEERFNDLAGVLEREVAIAAGDDARVEILVRLADLHEHHFVKPQQAALVLEEAVRIDPRHATAIGALERCYQATRAWPDLVRVLELRARMADSTSDQNGLLARIAELLELKMGDAEGATRTWQRVWDQDPSSERALSELARLAERANDWAAAAAYKAKLADLAPTSEAAARIHVVIAEMLSDPDRDPKLAKVHYEKAASIHPNTTQAWEALEKEARRVGDTKRAALFLEKRAASTESHRQKAQLFVELAQMSLADGDAPAAELAFERAIKADPSNEAAAEAMLAAHVRERRWAEARPVCDVLVAATPREVNPERAFILLRLATRIGFELGQKDRAFASALAAYRTYPSVDSSQDLLDACFDVRDDAASLAQCAAELDAVAGTAMELSPPFVSKLARIRLAQGAETDAMALFSKALIHDSEQRDALSGLADILVKREDWERACAFKQKLAHSVSDPEEQFAVLVEAGDLWAKRARNMPMAALAYEEALAIKPRDHGLLHTLLWLYGELACWEKLVETLRAVVDLHEDPIAKAKSVYAMAMVVRDHLGDLRRAAALLEEVLDLDPKRLDAFERIVRVHTELRDWMELKHAYGRMLRRLKTGGDVELRHALFFQLGLIYRDRLGDAARALDAFRAAQRLKPDAADVRKGIIELFVVTDQLDEGIAMVRAALKKRPLEAGLYAELYELFLRKRSFDRAWCAIDALVALGTPLDDEKNRFYTDYPPPVLAQVPGTLVAGAWRSHILHAELDPALTTIFALVTPAVLRARIAVVPFQQLRRSLGDPLRMNGAVAHEVLQAVSDACEILTFPAPTLHARKGQTIPLALAPAKNAMFVSLEACEALPTDALAFVVGKRLAEMRPELTARAACPSVSELRGLLQLAQQLADPIVATPNTGNPTFDRALAQSITREERQGLKQALATARAQGSELDVVRWSNLADGSAARVGLLLSGRLDAARRGMTSDPQMPGDLTPRDKLSQLLAFSVSDEYADLRSAIGMSVDANAAA